MDLVRKIVDSVCKCEWVDFGNKCVQDFASPSESVDMKLGVVKPPGMTTRDCLERICAARGL